MSSASISFRKTNQGSDAALKLTLLTKCERGLTPQKGLSPACCEKDTPRVRTGFSGRFCALAHGPVSATAPTPAEHHPGTEPQRMCSSPSASSTVPPDSRPPHAGPALAKGRAALSPAREEAPRPRCPCKTGPPWPCRHSWGGGGRGAAGLPAICVGGGPQPVATRGSRSEGHSLGPWGVRHSHPNPPTPTEQDERRVRFYVHMPLVVLTTVTLTDTEKIFEMVRILKKEVTNFNFKQKPPHTLCKELKASAKGSRPCRAVPRAGCGNRRVPLPGKVCGGSTTESESAHWDRGFLDQVE